MKKRSLESGDLDGVKGTYSQEMENMEKTCREAWLLAGDAGARRCGSLSGGRAFCRQDSIAISVVDKAAPKLSP